MQLPSDPDPTIWKATGSAIGAILSLVYLKPVNIRDAISRIVFATISGFLGGFVILEYFGWPTTVNRWIAASALFAALSWTLFGVAIRILQSIDKLPKR